MTQAKVLTKKGNVLEETPKKAVKANPKPDMEAVDGNGNVDGSGAAKVAIRIVSENAASGKSHRIRLLAYRLRQRVRRPFCAVSRSSAPPG